MLGAVAGSSRGDDLRLRAHKAPQQQSVLVVNSVNLVGAEIAGLLGYGLGRLVVVH